MSKILRLHSGGNEQYRGWQESSQITKTVIEENILDPAGGNARRTTTAIPTPFGQLHLLKAAFEFAAKNPAANTMYHRLVSQCWDLLEFLFYAKDTDAYRPRFVAWKRAEQLERLQANPRTALLGRTLDLYMADDRHFARVETLFLVFAEHKSGQERRLLGATSPFTLVFTHPDVQPLPVARKNGQGQYFDQQPVPLSERPDAFQDYVYGLFTVRRELRDPFFAGSVYGCLQALPGGPGRVNQLDQQGLTRAAFEGPYEEWRDDNGNPVAVRGVGLARLSQAGQVASSDWFIVPNPALAAAHPQRPLLLRPGLDLRGSNYFGGTPGHDTAAVGYAAPAGQEKLESRELPGLGELYPYLTVNDFLEDVLVELPFAVNREHYHFGTVRAEPGQTLEQRPFRYLLPLKRAYFDYFKPEDLARQLVLTVFSNHVQAQLTLEVSGGRTVVYERRYALPGPGQPAEQAVPAAPSQSPDKPYGGGRVSARLQIGVFPFYKYPAPFEAHNNAYSVMLAEQGETATAPAQLHFLTYAASGTPQELGAAGSGALRGVVSRTRQVRSALSPASTYYEVRGTHFDLLEVRVAGGGYGTPPATGLLAPRWRTDVGGTTQFTFAVDFGTTNTHVAVAANGAVAEPLTIATEREMQTVLLSQPEAAGDYDLPSRYQVRAFPRATLLQNREFVPSFIGIRGAAASFPIRTATCETPRFAAEGDPLLFGDANVGFYLSHDSELYNQPEDGRYETNLKWNTDSGTNAAAGKNRVRLYFRELLRLLKHKAALNGGDLNQVRLVWSYPLSMDFGVQAFFEQVWQQEYARVFGHEPADKQLDKIPESLAPYLYLRKIGKIVPTQGDSVVNLDIGGGTTDVLLLNGLQPAATFSFRFAGDVLWGDPGLTGADGLRQHNGLLYYYVSRTAHTPVSAPAAKAREVFLAALKNPRTGSADLVSLLFNFDEQLHFSQHVREAKQMRVLLLLHYAAVLYHVGQVCRAQGLTELPRHVTFSGKGSMYLRLLDLNSNLSTIRRLAQRVLEFASGLPVPSDFTLTLVDNAKEATANGSALRWDESGGQELERTMRLTNRDHGAELGEMLEKLRFVLPGDEQFAPAGSADAGQSGAYAASEAAAGAAAPRREVLISEAGDLREGVLANARHLLDFLTTDQAHGIQDLLPRLNVEMDADFVRDFLGSRFKDSLNAGYNALLASSKKPGEKLPESLFFFAFRDALFKLSQELYRKYYAAQTV